LIWQHYNFVKPTWVQAEKSRFSIGITAFSVTVLGLIYRYKEEALI